MSRLGLDCNRSARDTLVIRLVDQAPLTRVELIVVKEHIGKLNHHLKFLKDHLEERKSRARNYGSFGIDTTNRDSIHSGLGAPHQVYICTNP